MPKRKIRLWLLGRNKSTYVEAYLTSPLQNLRALPYIETVCGKYQWKDITKYELLEWEYDEESSGASSP